MAFSETSKGQQTADVQSITSSTDATPIVITQSGHGYSDGDIVHIMDHATNLSANGRWTVANSDSTTYELSGSVGYGAGAGSGGTASKEFELDDVTSPGGKVYQLRINTKNLQDGEWGEIFAYTTVHSTSGTEGLYDSQVFAHAPGDGPGVYSSLFIVGLNDIRFTLVQRAGTARSFDWDIIEQ